jgi:molybdopterin/thiamine biosynthesis adenylyltransferase/rhodanese-related sulfurtransferase
VALSPAERTRYQRHLSLAEVGLAGQEKLKAARVLVVGAGGLGSPAALYLAASGVGTLGLVDCDRVDASNLQRQVLFDTADVGRPKAQAACERLRALNPDVTVVAHPVELRAANIREIFSNYAIVLDGTDRLATRYLINDACVLLGKPLVSAAIHRFEGQAMTYVPGRSPCYRCLFSEADDSLVPNCAEAGVLGVLPGILGAIQATEAIKLILGVGHALTGRLLTYDALEMRVQEFRFERRADCAVCGSHPMITELRDAPAACANVPGIRRLSPTELRAWLTEKGSAGPAPLLVDVREPWEFESGHLDGARNLPLSELPYRLREIPPQAHAVFICSAGVRSLAACQLALGGGIATVANLEGGMRAWTDTA